MCALAGGARERAGRRRACRRAQAGGRTRERRAPARARTGSRHGLALRGPEIWVPRRPEFGHGGGLEVSGGPDPHYRASGRRRLSLSEVNAFIGAVKAIAAQRSEVEPKSVDLDESGQLCVSNSIEFDHSFGGERGPFCFERGPKLGGEHGAHFVSRIWPIWGNAGRFQRGFAPVRTPLVICARVGLTRTRRFYIIRSWAKFESVASRRRESANPVSREAPQPPLQPNFAMVGPKWGQPAHTHFVKHGKFCHCITICMHVHVYVYVWGVVSQYLGVTVALLGRP